MDVNISKLWDNKFKISHNYILNGDWMNDPLVEFEVDYKKKEIHPTRIVQDNIASSKSFSKDSRDAKEVSGFLENWIKNIKDQGQILYEALENEDSEYIHFDIGIEDEEEYELE